MSSRSSVSTTVSGETAPAATRISHLSVADYVEVNFEESAQSNDSAQKWTALIRLGPEPSVMLYTNPPTSYPSTSQPGTPEVPAMTSAGTVHELWPPSALFLSPADAILTSKQGSMTFALGPIEWGTSTGGGQVASAPRRKVTVKLDPASAVIHPTKWHRWAATLSSVWGPARSRLQKQGLAPRVRPGEGLAPPFKVPRRATSARGRLTGIPARMPPRTAPPEPDPSRPDGTPPVRDYHRRAFPKGVQILPSTMAALGRSGPRPQSQGPPRPTGPPLLPMPMPAGAAAIPDRTFLLPAGLFMKFNVRNAVNMASIVLNGYRARGNTGAGAAAAGAAGGSGPGSGTGFGAVGRVGSNGVTVAPAAGTSIQAGPAQDGGLPSSVFLTMPLVPRVGGSGNGDSYGARPSYPAPPTGGPTALMGPYNDMVDNAHALLRVVNKMACAPGLTFEERGKMSRRVFRDAMMMEALERWMEAEGAPGGPVPSSRGLPPGRTVLETALVERFGNNTESMFFFQPYPVAQAQAQGQARGAYGAGTAGGNPGQGGPVMYDKRRARGPQGQFPHQGGYGPGPDEARMQAYGRPGPDMRGGMWGNGLHGHGPTGYGGQRGHGGQWHGHAGQRYPGGQAYDHPGSGPGGHGPHEAGGPTSAHGRYDGHWQGGQPAEQWQGSAGRMQQPHGWQGRGGGFHAVERGPGGYGDRSYGASVAQAGRWQPPLPASDGPEGARQDVQDYAQGGQYGSGNSPTTTTSRRGGLDMRLGHGQGSVESWLHELPQRQAQAQGQGQRHLEVPSYEQSVASEDDQGGRFRATMATNPFQARVEPQHYGPGQLSQGRFGQGHGQGHAEGKSPGQGYDQGNDYTTDGQQQGWHGARGWTPGYGGNDTMAYGRGYEAQLQMTNGPTGHGMGSGMGMGMHPTGMLTTTAPTPRSDGGSPRVTASGGALSPTAGGATPGAWPAAQAAAAAGGHSTTYMVSGADGRGPMQASAAQQAQQLAYGMQGMGLQGIPVMVQGGGRAGMQTWIPVAMGNGQMPGTTQAAGASYGQATRGGQASGPMQGVQAISLGSGLMNSGAINGNPGVYAVQQAYSPAGMPTAGMQAGGYNTMQGRPGQQSMWQQ